MHVNGTKKKRLAYQGSEYVVFPVVLVETFHAKRRGRSAEAGLIEVGDVQRRGRRGVRTYECPEVAILSSVVAGMSVLHGRRVQGRV